MKSLKDKSNTGARTLASSPLTRYQSHIYLNTHLQPKIFHLLTTTSLSFKQFDSLKKTYINQFIFKCGYNNKWPKGLRHGTSYCGLDLKEPSTEATIKNIKGVQSLFYKPDSRKVVQLVITRYQHVSGLSRPILETSHNATKYANSVWVNNLIELLQDHGL